MTAKQSLLFQICKIKNGDNCPRFLLPSLVFRFSSFRSIALNFSLLRPNSREVIRELFLHTRHYTKTQLRPAKDFHFCVADVKGAVCRVPRAISRNTTCAACSDAFSPLFSLNALKHR